MKQTLRAAFLILLVLATLLSAAACQSGEPKFKKGKKVYCSVGNSFSMPVSGPEEGTVKVTDFEVIMEKENDIDEFDEWHTYVYKSSAFPDAISYPEYTYYKYTYRVKASGSVDPKFAGKKITFKFTAIRSNHTDDNTGYSIELEIDADGNFEYDDTKQSIYVYREVLPRSADYEKDD